MHRLNPNLWHNQHVQSGMKSLAMFIAILCVAMPLCVMAQNTALGVAYSVKPIDGWESHLYKSSKDTLLDNLANVLDSLHLKIGYRNSPGGGTIAAYHGNTQLPDMVFDNLTKNIGGSIIVRDSMLEVGFGTSGPDDEFVRPNCLPNPLSFSVIISGHPLADSIPTAMRLTYYTPNDTMQYGNEITPYVNHQLYVGIAGYTIQFDTFAPFNDTLNSLQRDKLDTKCLLTFTTEKFWRKIKGRKPEEIYVKGTVYFTARRAIINSNIEYTDEGVKYFINPIKK